MPRIENYIVKTAALTAQDKWLGTDSAGNVTKNFSPRSVAEFINESGIVLVAGQNNFVWRDDPDEDDGYVGSISIEGSIGDGTNLADLALLRVSVKNYAYQTVIDYLKTLEDSNIILVEAEEPNNFVLATVVGFTENLLDDTLYDMSITVIEANGVITADSLYALAVYPGASTVVPGTGDLNDTHTQTVASATWTHTHNLGKFASIQTFNAAGVRIYGTETQVSVNEITVEFGEALTGKSYAN